MDRQTEHTPLNQTTWQALGKQAVVFLGKCPYYVKQSANAPEAYLAGHTVGFTAPLVDAFLEQGAQVALLTLPGGGNVTRDLAPFFQTPPDVPGFKLVTVPLVREAKVACPSPILAMADALLRIAASTDLPLTVFVVYAYPFVTAAVLAAQEAPNQIQVVALLRGSDVGRFLSQEHNGTFRVYRRHLRACAHVMAVSESLSAHARALGIRVDGILPAPTLPVPERMARLPPGSPAARRYFCDLAGKACHLPEEALGKPWVVTCTRASGERPFSDVLNSMPLHGLPENATAILANPSSPECEQLARNVHRMLVPPTAMPAFLHAASIVVHPTKRKDFYDARPHVVTQAAYCGCPVILPQSAVSDGGAAESLSDANISVLTYDDSASSVPDQIAIRCSTLLADQEYAAELGRANRLAVDALTVDCTMSLMADIAISSHRGTE